MNLVSLSSKDYDSSKHPVVDSGKSQENAQQSHLHSKMIKEIGT
jgi:hypothetical protein